MKDSLTTLKVSAFVNAEQSSVPVGELDIEKVVWAIQKGAKGLQDKTVTARQMALEAEIERESDPLKHRKDMAYSTFKRTQLPAVTFSASFGARRNAGDMKAHTGLIGLDFDHVENPEELRRALKALPVVALVFISPSGDGVKAFFRVDPIPANAREHQEAWRRVCDFYGQHEARYTDAIDPQCKDLTRLCFLSYDPDVYFEPEGAVVVWTPHESSAELSKSREERTDFNIYEAGAALYSIPRLYFDGEDLHSEWAEVVLAAYHSGLSYDVVKAWDEMGRKHGKSRSFDATWRSAANRQTETVGLGTLIFNARRFGGRFGEKLCPGCEEEWISEDSTVCMACPEPVDENSRIACYQCRQLLHPDELHRGICAACVVQNEMKTDMELVPSSPEQAVQEEMGMDISYANDPPWKGPDEFSGEKEDTSEDKIVERQMTIHGNAWLCTRPYRMEL